MTVTLSLIKHAHVTFLAVILPPRGMRSIVMGVYVLCLFVCLPDCSSAHISRKPRGGSLTFITNITCGCGSALLRWRCDMLCTSGFVDDVQQRALWCVVHIPKRRERDSRNKFCSTLKSASIHREGLCAGDKVCPARLPCCGLNAVPATPAPSTVAMTTTPLPSTLTTSPAVMTTTQLATTSTTTTKRNADVINQLIHRKFDSNN